MKFDKLDIDWTFPNADTQYSTHGLHKYPARMPPQIPSTIIKHLKYTNTINKNSTIYDPFVGSGTTLVEARRHNINTIGNDINPFACLLSKAKSTRINPEKLQNVWDEYKYKFKNDIQSISQKHSDSEINIELPEVRDGWFPQPQLYQLTSIRNIIKNIESNYGEDISRIFKISLAETTRYTSYQRNGEFKRYRMAEEDREHHNPNVWELFNESVEDKIPRIKSFYNNTSSSETTTVFYADSRNITEIKNNSIDAIITSPPYGDHSTTVAYGQFSQDPGIISNEYTYDEMRQVDKDGLGGVNKYEEIQDLDSIALSETINTLSEKDGRNIDAINFFEDYYQVMKECNRVLKPGQPIVWVVANRTMSRVNIPTHIITKELCEDIGLEFITNIPRSIPNKTMPLKNAPENIENESGELMSDENILVMKKSVD